MEAVEGTEIDVYTNGNLLIAHSFPSFQKYSCLKGHFGNGVFNSILDFATFPGAILLTKNEAQNIEYLYRGRLFTTDEIVPKGVIKIENNDFSPLIESALQAKGFAKGQKREAETVGYSVEELDKIIDKISNNLSGRLYIVGLSNMSSMQKTYFKQFYKLIDKKDFVYDVEEDDRTEFFATFFKEYYSTLKLGYPDKIVSNELEAIGEKALYEEWLEILAQKKVKISYGKLYRTLYR